MTSRTSRRRLSAMEPCVETVVTCGLRLRVVLVDGQGAAIGAFRFEILLQAMEGRAEIAERVCIVRLKRDRPFKGNHGIFDPVKMKWSDAMNAMGVRIIGILSSCVAGHTSNSTYEVRAVMIQQGLGVL